MKKLLFVVFVIIGFVAQSQQRFPTGFPSQFNTGWNKWGYAGSDSGLIVANRDTNWLAKYSGTVVFKPSNKKFYWFDSTTLLWNKFADAIDTTSLSNRINLKLNISDTATMLLPYLRKADTTNKWINDIRRLPGSVNVEVFKNGAWATAYTDSVGAGGSGLTSVGLSLPSAFTVTNSPLTSNGTLNVIGVGTTSQYVRGNGTLATTDTGMIPNFHLKVRGLFSGTSPITFNSITGAIGINNATATGTKGAAAFTGSFSDNGSGLIDLLDVVTAGSCTNCDITFDAKGRATAFTNGSGGGGGVTLNNIGAGFRWLATPGGNFKSTSSSNTIIWDSTSVANTLTAKADTSVLATQYDLTQISGGGGGVSYIYSATGPTGADTLKYWIKTPATAAVHNVYTYINSNWERYGWLDSCSNVFSTKRPITVLICGQSNAGGIGTGGDTSAMNGIIAFSSNAVNAGPSQDFQTVWIKAQIGLSPFFTYGGVGTNNIGFQVAKQIKKHKDADIVRVIATYQGGTNINAWISDGVNPTFLRDTLISRLNRSGIDTIDVFCWHQGESGGITGFTNGGYVVDQRILYDTLCSPLTKGFFRNYTKYIAGGLGDLGAADSAQTWNVGSPEGAQRTLNWDGNLNTAWVPAWGLGHVDNTHFSGTAIDSLGYRYYTEVLRLPHAPYAETPEFNYDTTYDNYKVYVDRLLPYNGGGSSMKFIDAISLAYMKGTSPLLTINGTTTSGTVNLGASTGYSDAVSKMFQVNGSALISDGAFNTIISGNWNVTGNPSHNVVVANYPLTFNPASGGDESVLIGYSAGYTGSSNMPFNSVVIGSEAGNGNSSANFNVYVGRSSGAGVTGVHNTFLGYQSGQNSQGSSNTTIGSNANALNSTARVNASAIGANAKYNEDSVFVAGNALKRFIIGGTTSLPFLVAAPTNGQYYAWNTTNSQFELTTAAGATTIYNGDGTLSADRTVTGSGNDLTYNSIFNYRINANSLLLAESSPDAVYSVTISGANNQFLIGYTPTPTVYSKGYGVYIDTNNNAGLAIAVPTTVPLYATGNSAYVNGLQSGGGNYYKVTNITGNATAAIDQYWFNIDATGGNVTVTLPAASTAFGGFVGIQYVFKRTDNSGNTVTIARAGSDTIDGATSISLTTQYEAKEIQCVSTSAWAIK